MLKKANYDSPLGAITLLGDDSALWGVWFNDQTYFGGSFDLDAVPFGENASLTAAAAWLDAYFAHQPLPQLNLHFSGTPYRQLVQRVLCTIPQGQTATYQQLAEKIEALTGRRTAARAIGGAVGHNPLSLVVPCHRVVGKNGALTGYAGGLWRKQALLKLEASI